MGKERGAKGVRKGKGKTNSSQYVHGSRSQWRGVKRPGGPTLDKPDETELFHHPTCIFFELTLLLGLRKFIPQADSGFDEQLVLKRGHVQQGLAQLLHAFLRCCQGLGPQQIAQDVTQFR